MKKESKDIITTLLYKEIEEEYYFQIDSERDFEYFNKLVRAYYDFNNNKLSGLDKFVENCILEELIKDLKESEVK